ncbi:MAG: PHB depolymerase family esterase [Myxococcota bacterium]
MRWILALLAILMAASGCGDDAAPANSHDSAVDAALDATGDALIDASEDAAVDATGLAPGSTQTFGPSDRPAQIVLPRNYDGVTPLPVVFLLHGYGASGILQDALFGYREAAQSRGVYLVIPEGTVDPSGRQFWNATAQCCDNFGSGVDDESYLIGLLDAAIAEYPVDERKVYFTGHSNGGFMSHRMACRHSDRVTAIMSLAGLSFFTAAECGDPGPVSVLQVHGTDDDLVPYSFADDLVLRWVARGECTEAVENLDEVDLDNAVAGAETIRQRYGTTCAQGIDVQFWTITNGSHIPALTPTFASETLDWLLSQEKAQ